MVLTLLDLGKLKKNKKKKGAAETS